MPRGRKTQSGAPAQPIQAPTSSMTYGEGEAALESQRRTPVPDFASSPTPGPMASPQGGGQAAGGAPDLMAALQAAQAMEAPTSVMKDPTSRPGEPVTTPGPQFARPTPNQGLMELRAVAAKFPYPDLLDLIEMANREA